MVTVYIAAYNKGPQLESVITSLISAAKKAGNIKIDPIIVDDASTDNTQEVINRLQKKYKFIRSRHHTVNQGLGAGFKEVVQLAKYPKLLYIPGDNEADSELIIKMLKNRNRADVVLSYFLNREIRGRFRNFLSSVYGTAYSLTFDVYIQYFNGVGLYSVDKIKKIILRSNRFSITAELNTKLLCSGCSFYEIAGYKQTEAISSTAFSSRNFWEVISAYFRLIYEIKLSGQDSYNKKPVRIRD